jgi:diguanylate cyclase (GGDEF)-like protein
MFWHKSERSPAQHPSKPGATSAQPNGQAEFDRVLDAIGTLLSKFGEFAFDTDQRSAQSIRERCAELWREISLGPSKTADQKSRSGRRDFSKMLRFFEDQRQLEQAYVVQGIGNLRDAVQEFAQCLTLTVREDRETDNQIDCQLTQLSRAVAGNDLQAVRQQADCVVALVHSAIARRRDREKEQLLHLGTQVQALRNELDAVRTQATLDALTQLFNRAAFDREIEKVAALGLLLGPEPCLIMVDADHFKSVNDRYGHPVGDQVLRAIADNLVRHFLRKEDFVCRCGGEEFAIVVRDSTLDKVAARIQRARETLANAAITTAAGPVNMTFSAGVAALVPGETAAHWIERADRALYQAKHQGRNRVVTFVED